MASDLAAYCHYLPGLCDDGDITAFTYSGSSNWKQPHQPETSPYTTLANNTDTTTLWTANGADTAYQPNPRRTSASDDASSSTTTAENTQTHNNASPPHPVHHYAPSEIPPSPYPASDYYPAIYKFTSQDAPAPRSRPNKYTNSGKRIGRPRIDRSNTKCEKCGTSSTPQWRYLSASSLPPFPGTKNEHDQQQNDFTPLEDDPNTVKPTYEHQQPHLDTNKSKLCLCNACWLRVHKHRQKVALRRSPKSHTPFTPTSLPDANQVHPSDDLAEQMHLHQISVGIMHQPPPQVIIENQFQPQQPISAAPPPIEDCFGIFAPSPLYSLLHS